MDEIAGAIVMELDYMLRRKFGSMQLDVCYQEAKTLVCEVLRRRLTPAPPDAAICPSCGSTKANQHLAMCEIGTMPTPRR